MTIVETDRSRKGAPAKVAQEMASTPIIRRYQKEWFANLRKRVVENGEPYVLAPAVSPHEIFESFDIPYVSNEWWSGLVAARRQSAEYFNILERHGYHDGAPGMFSSPRNAVLALLVGGMLIRPLSLLLCRVLGRPA